MDDRDSGDTRKFYNYKHEQWRFSQPHTRNFLIKSEMRTRPPFHKYMLMTIKKDPDTATSLCRPEKYCYCHKDWISMSKCFQLDYNPIKTLCDKLIKLSEILCCALGVRLLLLLHDFNVSCIATDYPFSKNMKMFEWHRTLRH